MPDLDYLHKSVNRLWKSALKDIHSGQSMQVVAKRVIGALARMLRDGGGIPQLAQVCLAIKCYDGSREGHEAFDLHLAEVVRAGADMQGRILERVAMQFAGEKRRDVTKDDLSLAYLQATLDHSMLSHTEFVFGTFGSYGRSADYSRALRDTLDSPLRTLAHRLAKNPTAKDLRAPAMRIDRVSTIDLLNEEVS